MKMVRRWGNKCHEETWKQRPNEWENEYENENKLKLKRVGAHKLWNKFNNSPNILYACVVYIETNKKHAWFH